MNLFNILAMLTVIDESGITNIELSGIDGLVKTLIEFFSFGGFIGVGILLFSLLLKILPLPLDIYSRVANKKNSLKMERIRPELEKLQKQYANNKELYAKKMQALYKKEGYSMVASCLPTIFTLVFFIVVISSFNKYSSFANLEIYNNMAYSYNDAIITELNENYEGYYEIVYNENNVLTGVKAVEGKSLTEEQINAIIVKGQDAAAYKYKEEIKKYKFLWIENIWIGDLPWKKSFIESESISSLFSYSAGCSCQPNQLDSVLNNKEIFETLTGSELLKEEKDQVNGYLVLVVLSIGTMLLSQIIASKSQKSQMELQSVDGMNGQAAQTTKMMMWMMPIMFGIFAFMYSSAFSLYLIVSTVFSMVSTVIINKITEKRFQKLVEKEEEEKYNKRYGHLLKNKKDDN